MGTRSKLNLLVFLVFCFCFTGVQAQTQRGIPSDGRDFYLGYFPPSISCGKVQSFIYQYALVTSYYDTRFTVTYFDQNGQEVSFFYNLKKQHTAQVLLDKSMMLPNATGEVPEYKSCHIHSDQPVNVQYYSTGPNSGGMYLSLPTAALGTSYVIATLPANPGIGAAASRHFPCDVDSSSSEFMILAVSDNTQVTIIPNGLTKRGHVGANFGKGATGTPNPYTVSLNRGQIYFVKSTNDDEQNDMSGSVVTSTKPVGVIAGNEGAFHGYAKNFGIGDQRNLTIQQMIPVDYWTTGGYIGMPFIDSGPYDPSDPSNGEEYKFFQFAQTANTIQWDAGKGPRTGLINRYNFVSELDAEDGLEAHSIGTLPDGTGTPVPFMAEMYDYRMQNQFEPFPSPNQMNIVPIDRYRNRFLWGVPDDASQVHKRHFINVICQRNQLSKLRISKNGSPDLGLTSVLQPVGSFVNWKKYPQLVGRRFEVQPGSYYMHGDSSFVVYQYGMLGLDPDYDLGDNDDDDYYFSYAAPCGQSFGIDNAGKPALKVDTTCSSWKIHLYDDLPVDRGLAQVEVLKDPLGVFKRKPNSDSGYVSYNVDLDPIELTIVPGDTVTDFRVIVNDPLKNAEAWVWALNVAGNDTLVHLTYIAPHLTLTPDSGLYLKSQVGIDSCKTFVFKNVDTIGGKSFTVSQAHFKSNSGAFKISNVMPTLPHRMTPGDSVTVSVCFNAAAAGVVYVDTLLLETDCPQGIAQLQGSANYPLITADDYDFGNVIIGDTLCHQVRVKNIGSSTLTVNKQFLLHDKNNFSFPDSVVLPFQLAPGATKDVTFCFHPVLPGADSTTNDYSSNTPPAFADQSKPWSALKGNGIKPDLHWDRPRQDLVTQCDTPRVMRLYLMDDGTAAIHVDSVRFIGVDQDEFVVIANKLNENPLGNFDLSPHDTVWVDVEFRPNLTKGYRDRNATLIAYDNKKILPKVPFVASIIHADLTADKSNLDFGIVPPGTAVQKTIVLFNPGTADLIITNKTLDNPAFIILKKQSDTVHPGRYDTIVIQGSTVANGITTGNFDVMAMTNCAPKLHIPLAIITEIAGVGSTGIDYPNTYISCRSSIDSVKGYTSGTQTSILRSVQIIDVPADPGGSNQFAFTDGSGRLKSGLSVSVPWKDTVKYAITYSPSQAITHSAQVIFSWDTLSSDGITTKFYKTTVGYLNGTGLVAPTTLSVKQSSGQPYTAVTNTDFTVPIHFENALPPKADAKSVTFSVTFDRDLFLFVPASGVTAGPGYAIDNVSGPVSAGPKLDMITITAHPVAGVISAADTFVYLHLHLVVAPETASDFTISNVKFTGGPKNDDLCYVIPTTIPAQFVPIDACADPLLRNQLLNGPITLSVKSVRPNPARTSADISYDIYRDNTPLTIDVYNEIGEKVMRTMDGVVQHTGSHIARLDLANLPNGNYTIRMMTPDHVTSQRLLITK